MQVFYFTEKLMFLICGLFCSFTSAVIGALRGSLNLGNRKICWRSWGRNSSAVYKRRLPSKSVDSIAKANHTCPAEWFITSWILNYHKFCHQWSWSWCNKLFLMTFGSDHAWLYVSHSLFAKTWMLSTIVWWLQACVLGLRVVSGAYWVRDS